jgi:expansin (peptidoglycan-binding protein)
MRWGLLFVMLVGCSGDDTGTPPGGACGDSPAPKTGEGTYYDATGAGNCSFDPSPDDLMVAAMNHPDYGVADWCGACLEVTGPQGNSVRVRVVDQCPECKTGDLDLSPEAFQMLSPLSAGRIKISWHEVACDVTGPIDYHFKDGANQYWTAIQVRNHRYPIAKLEAMQNGAWMNIQRLDYNYFVETAGLGPGPYMLRVTDAHEHVVEDSGVALGAAVTRTGSSQFPECSP